MRRNTLLKILILFSILVIASAVVSAYTFIEKDTGRTKHTSLVLCSYHPMDPHLMRGSYYTPFGLYRFMHDETACLKAGGTIEDQQKKTWGFRTYLYPKHVRDINVAQKTGPGRLAGLQSNQLTRYGYYGTEQEQLKAPIGWQTSGNYWKDRNKYYNVFTEPGLFRYRNRLSPRTQQYQAAYKGVGYGTPAGYSVERK